MIKKYDRTTLYSRPQLKERGWTDSMIAAHLPTPDDYRDNPHYKCAGPMKFWLIKRVHHAERRKAVSAILSTKVAA